MDRSVATTGIVVWAQLLIAQTTGPDHEINHRLFTVLNSAQTTWHISIAKASLCIFANMN